jgi:hypothetical protein
MILFLDDDPARAALAYQRFTPEDRAKVIWCQTAEEAICTLRDYKNLLTKVMLDHDLGGEHFVHTAREDCGMEVVRYLERLHKRNELEGLKTVKYRIHTWNVDSGNVMFKRLKGIGLKVEYVPFGM